MTENFTDRVPPPPPTGRRWPRLLLLLLIFLCGGTVGAVCGAYWMRERMIAMIQHPEQVPDRILPRLRAELALSEDQARQVEEIVRRRHAAMEAHRAESYPRQLAEFKAMHTEVADLLSPEQRGKWSPLCDSVERRYLPVRPAGPPPIDLIFYRFDTNHDGALTEDEVPPGMWRRLQMADLNGDGKVTREEYQKAQLKANSD
ncbi:MAG: EF-hand domain-containing protein [Gemmataceae bacterium]|nr:EF-hand domain-containing protein [Gemmataceae bacterium]